MSLYLPTAADCFVYGTGARYNITDTRFRTKNVSGSVKNTKTGSVIKKKMRCDVHGETED